MQSSEPAEAPIGLAVFGAEPDEARLFAELAPQFGVVPTLTGAPLSVHTVPTAGGSRCVSVGHKSRVDEPVLRALRDAGVEHLSTRSIGLDHIDLDAATRLGIAVDNVAYSPDGVADHSILLMLMALRGAKRVVTAAERFDFRLAGTRARELRDLTVGVVGVGSIGAAVIERLHGFGCRVLAHNDDRPATARAEYVDLDRLLRESDVVTLHAPLLPSTRHLLGAAQFAAMRPGAVLVNTARGALVDTEALLDALERGHLGGAGLDVVEGEEGHFYADRSGKPVHDVLVRLQRLPNVVLTPHIAYFTERALLDTVRLTLQHCVNFERNTARDQTSHRHPVRGLLGGA